MKQKLTNAAFVTALVIAFTMLVAGNGRPGADVAGAFDGTTTATGTPTATNTATATPTATNTATATPTATNTVTPTPAGTPAGTPIPTPTAGPHPDWIRTILGPADADGLRPAVRLPFVLSSIETAGASTTVATADGTVQNLGGTLPATGSGPSALTVVGIVALLLGVAALAVLALTRLRGVTR